ncbi:hypothetical protein LEMLEM_LOCUS9146, partial [Lemmus lemmus]
MNFTAGVLTPAIHVPPPMMSPGFSWGWHWWCSVGVASFCPILFYQLIKLGSHPPLKKTFLSNTLQLFWIFTKQGKPLLRRTL